MLERFRKYLDRPQTVYTLILGYTIAAVLQGLAFGALIWFLRGFLSDDPSSATGAFWLLIALGVISFATMSVTMIAANRISAYDVCGNVIAKIGQRVSKLPLGWFDSGATGRVSAAVTRETDALSHLASIVFPQLISSLVTPATAIVVTLIHDWRLGLVMVVVTPVVWGLWRWAMPLIRREQELTPKVSAETAHRIIEQVRLQPVLRAQGLNGTSWEPLNKALHDEHATVKGLMAAQSRPSAAFGILGQVFFAAVLGTGLALALGGRLDVPGYLAIGLMAARFTTPISQSVLYAAEIQKSIVSLDAIGAIVDSAPLPEPEDPKVPQGTTIRFNDVRFGYVAEQPVERDHRVDRAVGLRQVDRHPLGSTVLGRRRGIDHHRRRRCAGHPDHEADGDDLHGLPGCLPLQHHYHREPPDLPSRRDRRRSGRRAPPSRARPDDRPAAGRRWHAGRGGRPETVRR